MDQKSKKSLQNRVFVQTLSALSVAELKAFKAFCNQSISISEKTKRIFESIYKVAPVYEKLTEEKLFSRFFPNSAKAKVQLNYALHDLNELLRKWLVLKELETDEHLQNQLFIRASKKRFLHSQFFKKTNQALAVLENESIPVPDTWYKQFETNFHLFYHVHTPKNQPYVKCLSDMEANLELFYHASKIRLLCQNIIRKKILSSLPEINEKEMRSTLDFAQEQNNIPFFALYLQLIQYIKKPGLSDLNDFIRNFKRDREQLERLDQTILLHVAAKSLIGPTMAGDQNALNIQFDLYRYAFENDLVLFNNEMSQSPFNDFLVSACMLGEFKIARRMLKKYEPYFNPNVREDFANLMWCTLFFHEKKYNKIELSLANFKFKHPLLRIRSRHLLLKSLYERYLKDKALKALILSELVRLRKYIQKQKNISESRKNMYFEMISVIRKLANVTNQRSTLRKKAKKELLEFLNDKTKKPISRNWLLEKVQEL